MQKTNKLFFDIETLPAPEGSEEALRYLHERKMMKKAERYPDKEPETFEDFLSQTGFDGAFGRVLVISYAVNDGPTQSICNPDNEKETIEKFWDVAAGVDLFVGHNIRDFDLPFIMQRSIILGVKPSWQIYQEPGKKPWEVEKYLDFARYRNLPIFDTMWEWSRWVDRWSNKNLEHLALAMGIPTPKEGIDGSQVAKFFEDGKVKDICDYCERDVETTRKVYKRMVFEGVDDKSLPF